MEYIFFGISVQTIKKAKPYMDKIYNGGGELLYCCDNDSSKWGKSISDFIVYPPLKILENPGAVIVVFGMQLKAIVEGLRSIGVKNRIVTYPWFQTTFIDSEEISEYLKCSTKWIKKNENELKNLYNLSDSYTKELLEEVIIQRKMVDLDFVETARLEKFFSVHDYFYDKEIIPNEEMTFIDGGAFDGDSIKGIYDLFEKKLKKIYAFEPDASNREQLNSNLKKMNLLDITKVLSYGMYEKNGILCFAQNNTSPMENRFVDDFSNEGIKLEIRTLDSISLDVVGNLMIKMDIEGSELSALKGAKETIVRYNPYMAICLYHKMKDILEIPQYIKKINPNYDFYLRAGGHLECYAIPKK